MNIQAAVRAQANDQQWATSPPWSLLSLSLSLWSAPSLHQSVGAFSHHTFAFLFFFFFPALPWFPRSPCNRQRLVAFFFLAETPLSKKIGFCHRSSISLSDIFSIFGM
jgi:hypothetical protein